MTLLSEPQLRTAGKGEQHRGGAAVQVQHGRKTSIPQFHEGPESSPPRAVIPPACLQNQCFVDGGMMEENGCVRSLDQNALFELGTPVMQRVDERQCQNRITQ